MLATFQALAVLLTSVLPGALFTFEYEREYTRAVSGDSSERLIVFLTTSAVFGMVSAPLLYQGYRSYIVTGHVQTGKPLPAWIWLIVVAYIAVPLLVGFAVGYAAREQKPGSRLITGPRPHPTAWDALFRTPNLGGFLRLTLKDGTLIVGEWAKGPQTERPDGYASAYPHTPDLYLRETFRVNDDGSLEFTNDNPYQGGSLS
jgi:hypothetical protein